MEDNKSEDEHISDEESPFENSYRDGVRFFNGNDLTLDDDTIKGLAFRCIADANAFYHSYGAQKGFNVRKGHKGYGKDKKEVRNMLWECSCAGFRREAAGPRVRNPKPDNRVGCKACFRVALEDGKYFVKKFETEHNHELLSLESDELKPNRLISPGDKVVISILNAAGHRTCHILDLLKLTNGGPSNLSFKDKDAYNFLNKQRNDSVRNGDASTALGLLDGMKISDVDFIYEPVYDANNSLRNLFWADGFSRAQYKLFGDSLVVDSTYNTNTYCYPLVILSGVDNNFKTCVFGAALMRDETTNSYNWLFEQFIKAMGGKKPLSIMTDQDLAMGNAIKHVLPETKHRLCSWHLLKNCRQKIKIPDFCTGLAELMKKNLSVEEFEWSWNALLEQHVDVAEHSWVIDLYNKREMWSEAHCVGHFIALMRTTQRAESLNSRFKLRVKRGFKIVELLKHFFNELHKLRVDAFNSQRQSNLPIQQPKRSALYHLVNHAAKVYSMNIFCKVQEQIDDEQALVPVDICASRLTFANCWKLDGTRWSVDFDIEENSFTCECKMLESTSLPCCHLFAAFKNLGLKEIPSTCIHERWTSSVGHQLEPYYPNLFSAGDPQRQRFMNLYKESVRWSLDASQTEPDTIYALDKMKRGAKRVRRGLSDTQVDEDINDIPEELRDIRDPARPSNNSKVANPMNARSRGARPNTLQKCGICGVAGHKRGKCPNKDQDGLGSTSMSN